MANFEAVTASSGMQIKKRDLEKFETLLKKYAFGEITTEVDESGWFHFYGYEWPVIYDMEDNNRDNDLTEKFYEELRPFVPKGKQFIIQCIGGEKCRYPLSATEIVITRRGIKYQSFNA